jgi:integrase
LGHPLLRKGRFRHVEAAAWESDARDKREGRIDTQAENYRQSEAQALNKHIEDFEVMLESKGNTQTHVLDPVRHVRRMIKLAGIERLSDLTADAVRRAISTIRQSGRSLRICNSILRSIKTFAAWLEADKRIRRNDLRGVSGFNEQTDRRRVRRDLTDDELERLIAAAQTGIILHRIDGQTRAMAYDVAAGTGFRRSELRSLTPVSFHLDDDPPRHRGDGKLQQAPP